MITFIEMHVFVIIADICKEDIAFYKYMTKELWEETISSACWIANNTGLCLKCLKKTRSRLKYQD